MIHVDANAKRFVDGFRAIDGEHGEQLLDRQRMFAAYALNGCDQQLRLRLYPQAAHARDIGGALADGHGLHDSGFRIDHHAPEQLRLFFVADVGTELGEFG